MRVVHRVHLRCEICETEIFIQCQGSIPSIFERGYVWCHVGVGGCVWVACEKRLHTKGAP